MSHLPEPSPSIRALGRVWSTMFQKIKPYGPHSQRRGFAPGGLVALLALLVGATLLAGCGSSDNGMASKGPTEILAASKAAAGGADSVHVVSRASQGRLTFASDLELSRSSSRAHVSVLGSDFEVIHIANTIYAKGNAAFYEGLLGAAAHVPSGTWLKASSTDAEFAQLAQFTDLRGQLNRLLSTPGSVSKGASTTIAGQKVLELKEKTKVYEGSLYVATSGKPYPILLVKSGGRERGRTSFSRWRQPVSLSVPSPVVEIGTLKR
jgi:hypothetical protein